MICILTLYVFVIINELPLGNKDIIIIIVVVVVVVNHHLTQPAVVFIL